MTDPERVEALAEVLGAHESVESGCSCGGDCGWTHGDWQNHVAQAVAAKVAEWREATVGEHGVEKDAWPFGAEAACRLIATVSWPNERRENRDRWAVTMLDRPDLLAAEVVRARERLEAAIARVLPPTSSAEPDAGGDRG